MFGCIFSSARLLVSFFLFSLQRLHSVNKLVRVCHTLTTTEKSEGTRSQGLQKGHQNGNDETHCQLICSGPATAVQRSSTDNLSFFSFFSNLFPPVFDIVMSGCVQPSRISVFFFILFFPPQFQRHSVCAFQVSVAVRLHDPIISFFSFLILISLGFCFVFFLASVKFLFSRGRRYKMCVSVKAQQTR